MMDEIPDTDSTSILSGESRVSQQLSRCKQILATLQDEIDHEDNEDYWVEKLGLNRDRGDGVESESREEPDARREGGEGKLSPSPLERMLEGGQRDNADPAVVESNIEEHVLEPVEEPAENEPESESSSASSEHHETVESEKPKKRKIMKSLLKPFKKIGRGKRNSRHEGDDNEDREPAEDDEVDARETAEGRRGLSLALVADESEESEEVDESEEFQFAGVDPSKPLVFPTMSNAVDFMPPPAVGARSPEDNSAPQLGDPWPRGIPVPINEHVGRIDNMLNALSNVSDGEDSRSQQSASSANNVPEEPWQSRENELESDGSETLEENSRQIFEKFASLKSVFARWHADDSAEEPKGNTDDLASPPSPQDASVPVSNAEAGESPEESSETESSTAGSTKDERRTAGNEVKPAENDLTPDTGNDPKHTDNLAAETQRPKANHEGHQGHEEGSLMYGFAEISKMQSKINTEREAKLVGDFMAITKKQSKIIDVRQRLVGTEKTAKPSASSPGTSPRASPSRRRPEKGTKNEGKHVAAESRDVEVPTVQKSKKETKEQKKERKKRKKEKKRGKKHGKKREKIEMKQRLQELTIPEDNVLDHLEDNEIMRSDRDQSTSDQPEEDESRRSMTSSRSRSEVSDSKSRRSEGSDSKSRRSEASSSTTASAQTKKAGTVPDQMPEKALPWSGSLQDKPPAPKPDDVQAVIWWSTSKDAVEVLIEDEEEDKSRASDNSDGSTQVSYVTSGTDDQTFASELQIDFSFSTLGEVAEVLVEEATIMKEEISRDILKTPKQFFATAAKEVSEAMVEGNGAFRNWLSLGSSPSPTESKKKKKSKAKGKKSKRSRSR
ncbi:expressed unknown protein [Seminavis robusta]|uniref:Uncharacterized protein n=1 Tax=Seminavis robusta TaxID=568900 RepID=A0A9N8HDT0_9STRA|nr:expressed unknown protein [Seminavis robusta]|eukprot:Sro440_g143560.1 n/a (842) ;mRNA; r:49859-52384